MEENIIGERIKKLRKEKNLTQDDLANLMNTSRVQINQWETGARELSANRIIDFASALDTSCEYLLRGVTLDKSDSYNQTGLDLHALNAFEDMMNLPDHKKKQALTILNGILGSDYFWHTIMPHLLAAMSIQENAALGGAYAGIKDFNLDHMANKLKKSIEAITLGNTAGYTDHILINKETAIAFQLQEAIDAFKILLKALFEQHKTISGSPFSGITAPYRSTKVSDEKIELTEFIEYIKAIGLTIDNMYIGKEES